VSQTWSVVPSLAMRGEMSIKLRRVDYSLAPREWLVVCNTTVLWFANDIGVHVIRWLLPKDCTDCRKNGTWTISPITRLNPWKPSAILWLHFERSAPYRPNLPCIVPDLGHSDAHGLSARVPEGQKNKNGLDQSDHAVWPWTLWSLTIWHHWVWNG